MLAPLAKEISLDRRATDVPRRFHWLAFLIASLAAAIVLVSMVAIPQWLSKQARWEALRSHVGEIGQIAASVVDGDLHRKLLDPANYSDELYDRALRPLVRFHSADPNIFYLYTMVDRGGVAYFVLDTATSPDLRTNHKLRASAYMERFDLHEEYKNDDWLVQIAAGKTYVNPTFEQDDYGDFLSATSPIYDSQGRYSGFVGVDFDLQYYFAQEARFRAIAINSLIAALIGSLIIGYLAARYYSAMHGRMQQLYDISIRDSLTGLLNRRGAIAVIGKSLARHQETMRCCSLMSKSQTDQRSAWSCHWRCSHCADCGSRARKHPPWRSMRTIWRRRIPDFRARLRPGRGNENCTSYYG